MGNGNPPVVTDQSESYSRKSNSSVEENDGVQEIMDGRSNSMQPSEDRNSASVSNTENQSVRGEHEGAIDQAGDAKEDTSQVSLPQVPQLPNDASAPTSNETLSTNELIPSENFPIGLSTAPAIVQPKGAVTTNISQINAYFSTQYKPPTALAEPNNSDLDLLSRIPGLFRLLDLYCEMGSNGAVDKIIIDQESMGRAMNAIRKGTYKSISRINFPALDGVSVRPIGIYGSKSAIVEFLVNLQVVDRALAKRLNTPIDRYGQLSPYLRSGIYLLIGPEPSISQVPSSPIIYIIYWPEDETWDDNARSSVQKNRVTFMRFLTKLAPDMRPLISEEHSSALVWKYDLEGADQETQEESSSDEDSDEDDRIVAFEVAKRSNEEEGAQLYPGFKLRHPTLDTSQDTQVYLAPGETSQAIIAITTRDVGFKTQIIKKVFNGSYLRSELERNKTILLGADFDEPGVQILFEIGALPLEAHKLYSQYKYRNMKEEPGFSDLREKIMPPLQSKLSELKKQVGFMVRGRFVEGYGEMVAEGESTDPDSKWTPDDIVSFLSAAPAALKEYNNYTVDRIPVKIDSTEYKSLKKHFRTVQETIRDSTPDKKRNLLEAIVKENTEQGSTATPEKTRWIKKVWSKAETKWSDLRRGFRFSLDHDDLALWEEMEKHSNDTDYHPVIQAIKQSLAAWIENQIEQESDVLSQSITRQIRKATEERMLQDYSAEQFALFLATLRECLAPDPADQYKITLWSLERDSIVYNEARFFLHATVAMPTPPFQVHTMTQIEMKADDMQLLDENPDYTPTLSISPFPVIRTTQTTTSILYMQLLNHGRRAFYALQSPSGIDIYLINTRDTSFNNRQKHIAARENRKLFFAVDEQTRLVACAYTSEGRSFMQVYTMDRDFATLQQRGAPDELTKWYQDGPLRISRVCFFSGSEEICLLESSGRIRVYSLQSRAFWPVSIVLESAPVMMQSSPDGSALLVIERSPQGGRLKLRVFHHASFGKNPSGIAFSLPEEFDEATQLTVSSLARRKYVYLIAHLPSSASLQSISLRISRTEVEYLFRQKEARTALPNAIQTKNNSLIDCFVDVWERFPIIPAIAREFTIARSSTFITFVCYGQLNGLPPIPRYFKAMIRDFKRRFQKPTGDRLDEIEIHVRSATDPQWSLPTAVPCRAGEWFVELICLIPIHIAVARDNRFLPLQDGVSSDDLTLKLLGSEVGEIINAITIGPYEAILGSYMATKPVKVVSSMGEQSVGKSFSLNHLVDTSFAGSAMRTTEGVWLSLCPAEGQIVVALDFEGVHSLERTAQEDMLLVLFNAAISNLVMFRNNFAISRNIANMFSSFQAGTRLFDHAQNPALFKGLLAIIIKDVVDADKKEIVNEFSSKFSEIVQREQGDNFITVLHNNQISMMAWDVIESKAFYTRFAKVGKLLFKQHPTHANAGQFLFTLKTLMAQLTAQDWGSIDRTIIKHRTSALLVRLSKALISGEDEPGPDGEREELKNYDTQEIIDSKDTKAIFYLEDDEDKREAQLAVHLTHFGTEPGRESIEDVQEYLRSVANMRIDHVRKWIDSNLARFMPNDHADITGLFRDFDRLSTALIANLQLCLNECNTCQLRCMRPRAHSAGPHDCSTSHLCIDPCDFCRPPLQSVVIDDGQKTMCGLCAGHDGNHICEPTAHLCGDPCHLSDKRGCQETCSKPIGHKDDGHVCAAVRHQCGQACDLQDIILVDGRRVSCESLCILPFNEPHNRHSCGDDRSCPVRCELCPRYCTTGNHFHGLQAEAMHLCGQDHPCKEDCESLGTCEIVQKPESVEMVYRGIHDTFSYTRYTQISRRLRCGIPIQPGQRTHPGQHIHSTDEKTIHHCTVHCSQCGYICHLPYGHPQRQHETAHGSMQHTVWALENSDLSSIEVDGHRFGALDGGAPQLCSMYCSHRGRHVHLDYCRNWPDQCREAESEHIDERLVPEPDQPKDWISHRLFWARTGFKDPYSKEDQEQFSLCDFSCPGPEHRAQGNNPANPSFCILPILHSRQNVWEEMDSSMHVSNDGHLYHCADPTNAYPVFHVIFVLDCSASMTGIDRKPLPNQPITPRLVYRHNNRFGAVLSALFQFLHERSAIFTDRTRRDSYSVVVFNHGVELKLSNNMTSSVSEIMSTVLDVSPDGGTDFPEALRAVQQVMEHSWSAERAPVVIFLSDGEGKLDNEVMNSLCERAVALGNPLSFWSISFGPYSQVLRAMADIAKDIASRESRGTPGRIPEPSDFLTAIDTIQLTQRFSNIATSLRKIRASLINPATRSDRPSRLSTDMHLT